MQIRLVQPPVRPALNLDAIALRATVHCLTGCAIGEVLGMVLGSAKHWSNGRTIAVSVVLAFVFGYALTMRPLLRGGIPLGKALRLALAADTLSIAIMEIIDNAFMLVVPGAMDAHLSSPRFWLSLIAALVLAGAAAFPVNRWLIRRGRGHAAVHSAHEHHGHDSRPQSIRPGADEKAAGGAHSHHG